MFIYIDYKLNIEFINYIKNYIGSIQVAAKPIHKLGLNNTILLTLRDEKYNKFYESILGTIKTNLS